MELEEQHIVNLVTKLASKLREQQIRQVCRELVEENLSAYADFAASCYLKGKKEEFLSPL